MKILVNGNVVNEVVTNRSLTVEEALYAIGMMSTIQMILKRHITIISRLHILMTVEIIRLIQR